MDIIINYKEFSNFILYKDRNFKYKNIKDINKKIILLDNNNLLVLDNYNGKVFKNLDLNFNNIKYIDLENNIWISLENNRLKFINLEDDYFLISEIEIDFNINYIIKKSELTYYTFNLNNIYEFNLFGIIKVINIGSNIIDILYLDDNLIILNDSIGISKLDNNYNITNFNMKPNKIFICYNNNLLLSYDNKIIILNSKLTHIVHLIPLKIHLDQYFCTNNEFFILDKINLILIRFTNNQLFIVRLYNKFTKKIISLSFIFSWNNILYFYKKNKIYRIYQDKFYFISHLKLIKKLNRPIIEGYKLNNLNKKLLNNNLILDIFNKIKYKENHSLSNKYWQKFKQNLIILKNKKQCNFCKNKATKILDNFNKIIIFKNQKIYHFKCYKLYCKL